LIFPSEKKKISASRSRHDPLSEGLKKEREGGARADNWAEEERGKRKKTVTSHPNKGGEKEKKLGSSARGGKG